jgi:hypothetical protein
VAIHRVVELLDQLGVVSHAPTLAAGAPRVVALSILLPLGAWRSLVARTVRVGEVPGSNPGAPIYAITLNFFTAGPGSGTPVGPIA